MKATIATRLFTQGCDEQLVCELTGNMSEAERAYKHTSNGMQKDISDLLYGNSKKPRKEPTSTVSKTPESVEQGESEKSNTTKCQQDCNVITNVTFNGQFNGPQPVINMYPVINVVGNVPSGLPIIVNLTVNVPPI